MSIRENFNMYFELVEDVRDKAHIMYRLLDAEKIIMINEKL